MQQSNTYVQSILYIKSLSLSVCACVYLSDMTVPRFNPPAESTGGTGPDSRIRKSRFGRRTIKFRKTRFGKRDHFCLSLTEVLTGGGSGEPGEATGQVSHAHYVTYTMLTVSESVISKSGGYNFAVARSVWSDKVET